MYYWTEEKSKVPQQLGMAAQVAADRISICYQNLFIYQLISEKHFRLHSHLQCVLVVTSGIFAKVSETLIEVQI